MPENKGTQTVSLIHYTAATSPNVNKRHQDIRELGIYQGGRLTAVVDKSVSLSSLIAEISDGTYQVKVETTTVVSLTAVEATPYFVLRWTYTGAASDYMEILAVATPLTNDLVIGKCIFTGGGDLSGFNYGDTAYPRATPRTHNLFLKVEPTEDTELTVRVRAGWVQNNAAVKAVIDQKSSVFTAPSANSKVYLVYINITSGNVTIDSSGAEAASPVAPAYAGKMVLAEVTLASTSTNITASMIKDVRGFIIPSAIPDELTLERNSSGELRIRSIENLTADPSPLVAGQIWIRTDL